VYQTPAAFTPQQISILINIIPHQQRPNYSQHGDALILQQVKPDKWHSAAKRRFGTTLPHWQPPSEPKYPLIPLLPPEENSLRGTAPTLSYTLINFLQRLVLPKAISLSQ